MVQWLPRFDLERRSWFKLAATAGAVLLFLAFYIENWGRDFTAHEASLTADASDELLRPLIVTRPSDEMTAAVKMAARRIRNWEFAGEATDGDATVLYYVRQNRLLRIRDDVVVKIENRGSSRVVHATSRGRLHVGDLGRNPRNLRRFMSELRVVLDGAAHGAALEWTGPTDFR
jgi:hypothetical protein